MSGGYYVDYEAIRAARKRVHDEKVREITSSFLERYENTLSDMHEQNLDKYVKDEYARLSRMLQDAWDSLDDDPDLAREISLSIGQRIHGLPRTARDLRRGIMAPEAEEQREEARLKDETHRQEREKQRKEIEQRQAALRAEEKAALEHIVQAVQNTFADPVERDVVRKELQALRKKFESQIVGADNIQEVQTSFDQELADLQKTAQAKAEAWREKKRRESSIEDIEDAITTADAVIKKHVKPEISGELIAYSKSLNKLRDDFRAGLIDAEHLLQKVVETENAATEVVVTEEIRREVLKDILKTTQGLGFIMNGSPTLLADGNVKLNMRRPGGENCTFLVDVKGGLRYDFDGYKGKACRKDIDAINKTLDNIYGIHLSNERIIWENPDEIGKTAVNNPDSINGKCL